MLNDLGMVNVTELPTLRTLIVMSIPPCISLVYTVELSEPITQFNKDA